MPADSLCGDKLLEKRRRKLDVLSGRATNQNRQDRPAIIFQILICCDPEAKFVAVHGISVLSVKTEQGGKTSSIRLRRTRPAWGIGLCNDIGMDFIQTT
jgi:hypothetical protein